MDATKKNRKKAPKENRVKQNYDITNKKQNQQNGDGYDMVDLR